MESKSKHLRSVSIRWPLLECFTEGLRGPTCSQYPDPPTPPPRPVLSLHSKPQGLWLRPRKELGISHDFVVPAASKSRKIVFSLQAARLYLGLSKTNKMKQSIILNANNSFSSGFLREGTLETWGLPLWVTGVLRSLPWDLLPPSTERRLPQVWLSVPLLNPVLSQHTAHSQLPPSDICCLSG